MKEQDLELIGMMARYGGSFVKALAEAAYKADESNYQRLKAAFPDIWQSYEKFLEPREQQ